MSRLKLIVAVAVGGLATLALNQPAATDEQPTHYLPPASLTAGAFPDPTVGISADREISIDQYVQMARHYAQLQSHVGSLNKAASQLQREIWAIEMLARLSQIAETTEKGKEPRLREALERLEPALTEVVVAYKLQQAEDLLREVAEGVPESESGKAAKKALEELGKLQ
jgi:hypothetical protein